VSEISVKNLLELDRKLVWHPYSSIPGRFENLLVKSARGVEITLEDGRVLIDGMSSWWTAIHGYNHPVLNKAAAKQLEAVSHVMFGGLTHRPAVDLAELLVKITPDELERVFFCDSGSVSIEVAMKMAIQHWATQGVTKKSKFLTIRSGYHGDTFGAMSVCDPINGMHSLFTNSIQKQIFISSPKIKFGQDWNEQDIKEFEDAISSRKDEIAAVILEPIVQGAGGMRFYSPVYLARVRELCSKHGVLLICDEIATGFGRSGKLFACEHSGISPDIICLGKALTGGYLSLAATLCTKEVADVISAEGRGCLMHGPTFMGNPLACAVSLASVNLLLDSPWQQRILSIQAQLSDELDICRSLDAVIDVRVLGAIGVVELRDAIDVQKLQQAVVGKGVWLRPFRNLLYTMPPYIIRPDELSKITTAIYEALT
jgi:adenosylmethionine-8-amino-7-oxononanoate aminotransferase